MAWSSSPWGRLGGACYAVYQARNIMMGIENKVIEFEDNCDAKAGRSMETILSTQNISEGNKSFNLYPNPNNGNMQLDYLLAANEKGKLMIYDITGKLITTYELNNSNNQLRINNDELINGIYVYHVVVNDKTVKTDKLIIIK